MKVENMVSDSGNKVPNQFTFQDTNSYVYFQSYDSIIARIDLTGYDSITLDSKYWNYSKTTSKYLNLFLNMVSGDIKKGIKNGNIKMDNLNPKNVSSLFPLIKLRSTF